MSNRFRINMLEGMVPSNTDSILSPIRRPYNGTFSY